MRKLICTILTMLAVVIGSQQASAQQTASVWWGYGDGKTIGTKQAGKSSTTLKQVGGITIPSEVLAGYAGARIKAVRFAVAADVTEAEYFFTSDIIRVQDSECTPVGSLRKGWHEFTLATPYSIKGNETLYAGYRTVGGSYPIAVTGEKGTAGMCWRGNGTKVTDYGAEEGEQLCFQLLLERDDFEPSLIFEGFGDRDVEKTGGKIDLSVSSTSPVVVTDFSVAMRVDGYVVDYRKFEAHLSMGETAKVAMYTPALEPGEHTFSVEFREINGKEVDKRGKSQYKLNVVQYFMPRMQVIEEGTGTWCGYCVRGIVGLRYMNQNHPDDVACIAVHGRDKYEVAEYATLISRFSGFPTSIYNRQTVADPSSSELERVFSRMDKTAEAQVKLVSAQWTNSSRTAVKIKTRTRFAQNHDSEDYRLTYVCTEDSIYDSQSNYYSGGGQGPMGGFENMSSYVNVYLMEVARGLASYYGIEGSVPTTIEEGVWYDYEYTYTLPSTVKKKDQIHLVVLLQNPKGTEIFNAAKCTAKDIYAYDVTPMPADELLEPNPIEGDYEDPSVAAVSAIEVCAPAQSAFDLSGRKVSVVNGLGVKNGKVVFVRP